METYNKTEAEVLPEVVETNTEKIQLSPEYVQSITGSISNIFRKLEHIASVVKQASQNSENPTAYAIVGGFIGDLVTRATSAQYKIDTIAQDVKDAYNEAIDEINTVFSDISLKEQGTLTKLLAPVTGLVASLESPAEFELKKKEVQQAPKSEEK